MNKATLYTLVLFVFSVSCQGQSKNEKLKPEITPNVERVARSGPKSITRNMIQDRRGDIWIASWEGVFRYDGKSFINMTADVSTHRFFSLFEDSKGNLWFGSIGGGVYLFDGNGFQNFTTQDGLPNNEIVSIYEDGNGNIWLGANGGVSRYNGTSFQNYILSGDEMAEDHTGKKVPDFTRPPLEVNAIIQDNQGRFWFATRGNTFIFDGKAFIVLANDGKPFKNVRCLIRDLHGNTWLGGQDGFWRCDGMECIEITKDFVGYIYQDRRGNIWTSSAKLANQNNWVLTRYEVDTLMKHHPSFSEMNPNVGALFGIIEDDKGNLWFGAGSGVYRYDGMTITDSEGNQLRYKIE